jgi:hypothetical protein
LKKQITTAFEPMYLGILNNDLFGFAFTTARYMLDHLFLSYGSITDVDLEHNWKICVNNRTHSNLWSPYSSRFRIALSTYKQEESPSVRHKSSRLCTPISLQLGSYTVLAVVGMIDFLHSRLGMRSKLTLQWPITSTIKCRVKQLLPLGTPTQLWHNLLMKILQEQPLMHLPTLPQPLQWTAALLQH